MTHHRPPVSNRPDLAELGTSDAPGLMMTALAYAGRRWHVFPLRPGDKRPALRADWEGRATATDTARIWRCWNHAPYNIGIACGPSGLVVIDLDTPKPGDTPPREWASEPGVREGADVLATLAERHGQPFPFDTHTVRTASGGMHLYFTAPPGMRLRNTAGRLGWLIDTRANGGYIVAAGSTIGQHAYVTVNDVPPAPLPDWLAALLADPGQSAATPLALPTVGRQHAAGYAGTALRGEVQHVLEAAPGTRNHTLNQAAFALGQLTAARLLPDALVYDCLMAAGQQIGLSSRECDATIRSGLRSGAHKPRRPAA